jgi:hypothetical protein
VWGDGQFALCGDGVIAAIDVIVRACEAAGLSQRGLAAKLKRSGSLVRKMESQVCRVDVLEFIDIARAILDVRGITLLYGRLSVADPTSRKCCFISTLTQTGVP